MQLIPMEAALVLIGFPVIALALPLQPWPSDMANPPDALIQKPLLPPDIPDVPATDQSSFMSDERLIQDLHAFNAAEIRKGILAETMAISEKVKALAKQVLVDHLRAEVLVDKEAERLGIVLLPALPAEKQLEVDQLAASGGSFDQQYLASLTTQNEVAILHLDLGEKTDRGVRRLNDTLLPMFQRHSAQAKRLSENVASAK